MTPKEKAEELVNKMYNWQVLESVVRYPNTSKEFSKQCALIAVEEILKLEEYLNCFYGEEFEYWQEVKTEIEKL